MPNWTTYSTMQVSWTMARISQLITPIRTPIRTSQPASTIQMIYLTQMCWLQVTVHSSRKKLVWVYQTVAQAQLRYQGIFYSCKATLQICRRRRRWGRVVLIDQNRVLSRCIMLIIRRLSRIRVRDRLWVRKGRQMRVRKGRSFWRLIVNSVRLRIEDIRSRLISVKL